MRNIIKENEEIDYQNYNDIIYDFDYIEKELGKLILVGKKRFTSKIKFIKYLYEGFNSSDCIILGEFKSKYGKRELNNAEKDTLTSFIKNNKNN